MTGAKAKPHGPIPPGFAADDDGMLLIHGQRADALADRAGDTPLFVYDMAIVRDRVKALRAVLPGTMGISFAIKANPMPALLASMRPLVDGFDIASGGELTKALAANMPAQHISFAGPGKRDDELAAAITAGVTINLESAGEARRAIAIADRLGITPNLAVRVNPDFDLKGSGMRMGGGARPFGVDADQVPALVRTLCSAGANWRGFHIFAGSQALDAAAISDAHAASIALAATLADAIGAVPAHVTIGGGLGVPYFPNDRAVDIAPIGDGLAGALAGHCAALATTHFSIELGRWLVAESGVYLSRIVDRKMSHGETFLVIDGGMHHQLAASGNFGTVIKRNYPVAIANHFGRDPVEIASVVGCLCTPLDRLADQVALPVAHEGDLVALFQAGAYGASASPQAFLGHPPPRELLLGG